MTGHLKDNLFVLTALQGDIRGSVGALYWSKIGQKSDLLRYSYIYNGMFRRAPISYQDEHLHNIFMYC